MKLHYYIIALIGFGLCCIAVYDAIIKDQSRSKNYFVPKITLFSDKNQTKNPETKTLYTIAILTPASHPSLEKIENGFKKTMTGKKYSSCTI